MIKITRVPKSFSLDWMKTADVSRERRNDLLCGLKFMAHDMCYVSQLTEPHCSCFSFIMVTF